MVREYVAKGVSRTLAYARWSDPDYLRFASDNDREQANCSIRLQRYAFWIEQPMQVHDEIAHMSIVNGLLGLRLPCSLGRFVIRVDANDIDVFKIAELNSTELFQLAAEHQMKKLLLSPSTLMTIIPEQIWFAA